VNRLSAIPRELLPEDQRRFYDAVLAIRRRPVSGPFIVLMNSAPDLAARFAHLGHYFHSRGQADESVLSMRVRGFASLIGSRALDAPYEWAAWVNWALEAGVPQKTVDEIRDGISPTNLTAEEKLISAFCSQLISGNHRVNDSTFKAALEHFGNQGLVELVVTLGYFTMIALPLNAFEIGMTDAQKGLRKPFTPLGIIGDPWISSDKDRTVFPQLSSRLPTSARIPLLSAHEDVAPENQHFIDRIIRTRGWISGVFQVLLHSPDTAERIAATGSYFLYETSLAPSLRALTWIIVARELDCNYTWHSGVCAAREAGLSERLISSLENGQTDSEITKDQKTVFDFCYQLLRGNHHVNNEIYQAAIECFGVPATVQISATLGYIAMMSLVANAFEVDFSEDASKPAL
jgi:4-carboxymuconolactone decarboxylase